MGHLYTIELEQVEKKLTNEGFVVKSIQSRKNNEQRITDIYLEGSIIKYFSLVDGPGYYEKGKPDSANVYCENGDTKYGADFTSIVSLVRELRKIEQLHKKNQPVS